MNDEVPSPPPPSSSALPDSFLVDSLFGRNTADNTNDNGHRQQQKKNTSGGVGGNSSNDGEDDDAALVDSFFLPGGLLADEDENNNGNLISNNQDCGLGSMTVPSNPWEKNMENVYSSGDENDNNDDDGIDSNIPLSNSTMNDDAMNSDIVVSLEGRNIASIQQQVFDEGQRVPTPFDISSRRFPDLRLVSEVQQQQEHCAMVATKLQDGSAATNTMLFGTPPPGFMDDHQHNELLSPQHLHEGTNESMLAGNNLNNVMETTTEELLATATYSNAAKKKGNNSHATPTDARHSRGSSGYIHHQSHSSSTMGEELLMRMPSPASSSPMNNKTGKRRKNRKMVDVQESPTGRKKETETPKGSGRLMIDQPSPSTASRRLVGRSRKSNTAEFMPSDNVQYSAATGPNRNNNEKSSSNLPYRLNKTNIDRSQELHGGSYDDDGGWRDGRRAHHHYHPKKKYNVDHNRGKVVGGATTGGQLSSRGYRALMTNESNNNNNINPKNMISNVTKNIYETLDDFEQDDDAYDDNDDETNIGNDNTEENVNDDDDDASNHGTRECHLDEDKLDGEDDEESINEEENPDDQAEDEEDADANSIPLDICTNSVSGSSTSSLSTSSDVDSPDEESSHSSDESEDGHLRGGEGVGYDTDQAHVSQVIGIGDDSALVHRDGASNSSTAPCAVCPAEETPFSHTVGVTRTVSSHGDNVSPGNWKPTDTKAMLEWLQSLFISIIRLPSKLCHLAFDSLTCRIRQSKLYAFILKAIDDAIRLVDMAKSTLQTLSLWISEAKDATAALVAQFLTAVGMILAGLTKALILTASFLFQVWKYSLIEAAEESSVTICYLVFYFMPDLCSLLMNYINLPHWSPHLMTWVVVFLLCNQVKPGSLHQEDDLSIFRTFASSTSGIAASTSTTPVDNVNATNGSQPCSLAVETSDRKTEEQLSEKNTARHSPSANEKNSAEDRESKCVRSVPKDERACRTILKILRLFLPGFFLADGFSSEFGTIMGVSGASRLTTAYMMSLVRKNLVSSPIGWVSWAVQVLLTTYHSSWAFLDPAVLVVGLSSIRLIRYLDGQRERNKRQ
jgi:hypothetical protein